MGMIFGCGLSETLNLKKASTVHLKQSKLNEKKLLVNSITFWVYKDSCFWRYKYFSGRLDAFRYIQYQYWVLFDEGWGGGDVHFWSLIKYLETGASNGYLKSSKQKHLILNTICILSCANSNKLSNKMQCCQHFILLLKHKEKRFFPIWPSLLYYPPAVV
jgi:hypothetical protein